MLWLTYGNFIYIWRGERKETRVLKYEGKLRSNHIDAKREIATFKTEVSAVPFSNKADKNLQMKDVDIH
jgi:hypothetical protein